MIDVTKHIDFWRDGAEEDWDVPQDLVKRGRARHGLFFAHLALEKALKANICRITLDIPPRLHNLVRLAELAKLSLQPNQIDILAAKLDSRIEPFPCGEKQWKDDVSSPLSEIARREGEPVNLDVF